ncbi:MAG: 30S ribosomal protein S16 [Candidatus Zambryskibacteria bacterium]|nr:30S ribosomal protein S16 [Candidatus Zambryskibacteria bacterium]
MLKIRLQRVGRKAEPTFRLVLTDSKNGTKSGKYLENLGNYDARRGEVSTFKADRITHWMKQGAQTSTTVHNLLITKKITTGKKLNALPLQKAIVKDAPAEEAPKVVESSKIETKEEFPEVVEAPIETPTQEPTETPAEVSPAPEVTKEPVA